MQKMLEVGEKERVGKSRICLAGKELLMLTRLGLLFSCFFAFSGCGVWFCREREGIKYNFRLVLHDNSGSVDTSASLYFSTHGDDLFDKNGNIKYNHSPIHPQANGIQNFSEFTRNYTECESKPGIEDIAPVTILIRGGKYQADTTVFTKDDLQHLQLVNERYQLPTIVLKPQ